MLSILLTPFKWLLLPVAALGVYLYFVATTPVAKANEFWQAKPACAAVMTYFQVSGTKAKLSNGSWGSCTCVLSALERGLGEQNAVQVLEMLRQTALARWSGEKRPRFAEEAMIAQRLSQLPSAKACLA